MSTIRKIQYVEKSKSFSSIIPKHIVEALGIKKGDKLKYSILNNQIIITPVVEIFAGCPTTGNRNIPNKEGAANVNCS